MTTALINKLSLEQITSLMLTIEKEIQREQKYISKWGDYNDNHSDPQWEETKRNAEYNLETWDSLNKRRNELKAPKKDTMVYQEMGEKTNAEIEYKVSYGGGFYITTDLVLKGRGIKINGDGSNHKRGKKTYNVTKLAMEKLKKSYNTCYMALL